MQKLSIQLLNVNGLKMLVKCFFCFPKLHSNKLVFSLFYHPNKIFYKVLSSMPHGLYQNMDSFQRIIQPQKSFRDHFPETASAEASKHLYFTTWGFQSGKVASPMLENKFFSFKTDFSVPKQPIYKKSFALLQVSRQWGRPQ